MSEEAPVRRYSIAACFRIRPHHVGGRALRLFLPFVLLLLGACTTVQLPAMQDLTQGGALPQRHVIKDVPVIAQQSHYCGPAALASALQYNGDDLTQDSAAAMVYTPGRTGTFQHDMVSAIQRRGFLPIPVRSPEALIEELAADHPVILFQNLGLSWYPLWHYSVIAGYDLPQHDLLVHGGADKAYWKSFKTVVKTWKRAGYWGYTALKPGMIAPSADAPALLEATAGLEKADQLDAAERSYAAIAEAWPGQSGAFFGLGNVAMSQKHYKAAARHYRQAIAYDADHWPAYNNLAYSLHKQGDGAQACALLDKTAARAPDGPKAILQDSYQDLCSS